jgi:hypothetical protein
LKECAYTGYKFALHEHHHGRANAVQVAVHGQPEVILRLIPLYSAFVRKESYTGDLYIRTFSSLFWSEDLVVISVAKVRGPWVRVSCRPSEPAVSAADTDLDGAAGTSLKEGS